jgi:hypothetical protein
MEQTAGGLRMRRVASNILKKVGERNAKRGTVKSITKLLLEDLNTQDWETRM